MSDTEDLAALNDRLMAKNHALAEALSRAGKELTKAKSQLAQLAQPPLTFATMVKVDSTRTDEDGIQHASAEVISGTRRMVVPVASNVNAARLTAGATVMLNEKLVLVEQRDADTVGQIRSVKQVLDDGRLIVTDASGNPVLIRRSGALAYAGINQGDRIIVDPSVRLAIEALPAEGDKDLVLEDCEMVDTDLSFEYSQVQATIKGGIVSVKNPVSGSIEADEIGEVILDEHQRPGSHCVITVKRDAAAR